MFHILDQLCLTVILVLIPLNRTAKWQPWSLWPLHNSARTGPQRLTPSCGICRFSTEGISLPLPNKIKMCQHNFSLVSPDQRKYLKTSPWSPGQWESPALMCSIASCFLPLSLNGFCIFVHVLFNLSCGHFKSECLSETSKQKQSKVIWELGFQFWTF